MNLFDTDLSISTEMIDHQYNNEEFKNELIAAFQAINDKIDSGEYRTSTQVVLADKETKKILDLVYKRIGIRLKFVSDEYTLSESECNAAIVYYRANLFNAIIDPFTKMFLAEHLDQIEEFDKAGSDKQYVDFLKKIKTEPTLVNTKEGRIAGGHSKVTSSIVMDFVGLYKQAKCTAEELAAILVHEVGHVFSMIVFENKVTILNQALYNVFTNKNKEDKDKMYQVVYKELKVIDGELTEKQVREMISGNIILSSFGVFRLIKDTLGLELLSLDVGYNNDNYNNETLADTFAVRMGFGNYIFTGLDKLNKFDKRLQNKSNAVAILCCIIISVIYIELAIGVGALLILVLLLKLLGKVYTFEFGGVYKDEKERLQKLINEYIDSVKHVDDDEYKKDAIEVIKTLKIVTDKLPEKYSAIDKLLLAVLKDGRMKESYGIQQDILERLASNELFVKAIELELLGKGR